MSYCEMFDYFNGQGLKIHSDPKLNRIDSSFILKIINELTNVHNLLVDDQMFIAGFQMGRLQGDLVILMEQMEAKEKMGVR